MTTFAAPNDAPFQIEIEGRTIVLDFDKTGPNTGRVSWNIPTPATGCTPDNSTGAYCGLLVTIDSVPASVSTGPKNGTIYTADPTGDVNLHAGDKIGTALVVGAFYDDTSTTFFDISGLVDGAAYYVSAYAIDCQNRYHIKGAHAYSLEYGKADGESLFGAQTYTLNAGDGVALTDLTGLLDGNLYSLNMFLDENVIPESVRLRSGFSNPDFPPTIAAPTSVNLSFGVVHRCHFDPLVVMNMFLISGTQSQTYQDLINTLNKQFALINNPPQSPIAPDTGSYYWDATTGKLFQWDGTQHVEIPVIVELTDPTIVAVGEYWYNPSTNVLSIWDGTNWNVVSVIEFSKDPTILDCSDHWYNGSDAYNWNGSTWCQLTTFAQIDDPSCPPTVPCGSYWFDTTNSILNEWDIETLKWNETSAIFWDTDPNNFAVNDLWYNDATNQLMIWTGTAFNVAADSTTTPPLIITEVEPATAPLNSYWYKPSTEEVFLYNQPGSSYQVANIGGLAVGSNLAYPTITPSTALSATVAIDGGAPVALNFNVFPVDSYDNMVSQIQAAIGAAGTVAIVDGDIRITSATTGPLSNVVITDTDLFSSMNNFAAINTAVTNVFEWGLVPALVWGEDPTNRDTCDLWWNSVTDVLNVWDVTTSAWDVVVSFTQTSVDPALALVLNEDTAWFNTTDNTLSRWLGNTWQQVAFINFLTDPTLPAINQVWKNTTTGTWQSWDGANWVTFDPIDSLNDPTSLPNGTFWFDTTNNLLFQWNGITWVNISFTTIPLTPSTGYQYYDTTLEKLFEWDGTQYIAATLMATALLTVRGDLSIISSTVGSQSKVRVEDENDPGLLASLGILSTDICSFDGTDGISGQPSYSEVGVGDDGSPDERRELAFTLRAQLGYPTVEVELTEYQIDTAIDLGLEEYRKRASSAYQRGFFFLDMHPGVSNYFLTDKSIGLNKIVTVMGIYRFNSAFLSTATGAGVYAQVVLQELYNAGSFDLSSYHLIADYIEQLEQLFATRVTYYWDEPTRRLDIYQSVYVNERVLVEAALERTEQELFTYRYSKNWIEKWALSESRIMLAEVRGKYASLPGAGGGVSLNASELLARADADKMELIQQIDDYISDVPEAYGELTQFVIG